MKTTFSLEFKNEYFVVYKRSSFLFLFRSRCAVFKSKDFNQSLKILTKY